MKSKDQTLLEEAYKNVVLEGETKNPYDDPFNKLIIRIRHAKKTGDNAKKALAQSELETLAKRHNKMKDPEVLEALDEAYESPEQDFSYYSGPAEDIIFLDDMEDASNLKRKVEEGKKFKTAFVASKADAVNYGYPDESGFKFYVFYTPQDFARPALIPV